MKRFFEKLRIVINKLRNYIYRYKTKTLRHQIEKTLQTCNCSIPVFIVSYNNAIYVQNITKQLNNLKITPIVIDNNSSDTNSIMILKELEKAKKAKIIYSKYNFGYLVGFINSIYEVMPKVFAYTDPDLELNPNLPKDFLQTLLELTNRYKFFKAGFALEVLENEPHIQSKVTHHIGYPQMIKKQFNFRKWESQFWSKKLEHPTLEVYSARVDTTFALYNKDYYFLEFYDGVRVAGDFTALHLPWYPNLDIMRDKSSYQNKNNSSTWTTK